MRNLGFKSEIFLLIVQWVTWNGIARNIAKLFTTNLSLAVYSPGPDSCPRVPASAGSRPACQWMQLSRDTEPRHSVRSYPGKRDQRRVRTQSGHRWGLFMFRRQILHTRRLWVGDFTFTACEKQAHSARIVRRGHSYTQVWWGSHGVSCLMLRVISGKTLMMLITWGGGASSSVIGDTETGPWHQKADHNTWVRLKLKYRQWMHWFRYLFWYFGFEMQNYIFAGLLNKFKEIIHIKEFLSAYILKAMFARLTLRRMYCAASLAWSG